MTWYQHIGTGKSPKMKQGLPFLIYPGVPFEAPEDREAEFANSIEYVEAPGAEPLEGDALKKAVMAKRAAWEKWAEADTEEAKKGTPWKDRPPFEYRPGEPSEPSEPSGRKKKAPTKEE